MRYLSLFLLILLACQPQKSAQTDEQAPDQMEVSAQQRAPGPLHDCWKAHGGLDRWEGFNSLTFKMTSLRGENSQTDAYLIHLKQRHERISGQESIYGYDGKQYWQKRLTENARERDPRFLINLQFYFFALPFVLSDPGVVLEELADQEIQGKSYNVVKAGFEAGTGVAPEDQYLLFLDPQTQRLEYLLYSVTYFDKERASKYNAAHYEAWQEINGLWVPAAITSYVWDAEKSDLGEKRYSKSFSDIVFSEAAPDSKAFEMPEGAVAAEE